jgi:hypothetical protein
VPGAGAGDSVKESPALAAHAAYYRNLSRIIRTYNGGGDILIAMLRFAAGIAIAATLCGQTTGPDPREIPVPPIKTSIAAMPGVDQLPDHPEMPDALLAFSGRFLPGKTVTRRFDDFPTE